VKPTHPQGPPATRPQRRVISLVPNDTDSDGLLSQRSSICSRDSAAVIRDWRGEVYLAPRPPSTISTFDDRVSQLSDESEHGSTTWSSVMAEHRSIVW